ncbi:hypothetical protein ACROYT_G028130 [Oculina patagonica]
MNGIKTSPYGYVVIFWLSFYADVQAPHREGDVILGGLLKIHSKGTSENQCGELVASGLDRAVAMIFAIEKINNDSNLLTNITIGYDVRDYCETIPKATLITCEFFKDRCLTNISQSKNVQQSVMALIGPDDSSTAVVIGGCLQMLNYSGISAGATSSELSSSAYKHLHRMAPSDTFRAKAMADIVEHFNWTYVAAVGKDDSYGRNGLWSLVKEAAIRNNSFCVAMTEFVPNGDYVLGIKSIVTILRRQENIRVVILWLHGSYLTDFFSEVNRQKLTGRVWVLSDSLQSAADFSTLDESTVLCVLPHRFSDPRFEEHKNKLTLKTIHRYFPEWWSEIITMIKNCSESKDEETCFHEFVHGMHSSYSPYVIDAVYSVAHALDILIKDTRATDRDYKQELNMDMNVMQSLLSKVKFAGLTGNISFDKLGDRGSAFYDISTFQHVAHVNSKEIKEVVVGKWKQNDQHEERLHIFGKIRWNSLNGSPPKSECLDQCSAGTRKAFTSPCCWQCVSCPRGTINPIPGSERCIECPKGKQSNEARTKCVDLPLANLNYSSAGGIVILVFSACGIIATLFSLTVTCRFWNTPIVKASNREFNLVLLNGRKNRSPAIEPRAFRTDNSKVQRLDTDITSMTAESLNFWLIKFVEEVCKENGERLWARLRRKGYFVKRSRIMTMLREIDPEGVESRKRKRLRRRTYQAKGPNYVWHIDGYDKLKPYGFCVHGGIDGFSRRLIWLEVGTTNNNPEVITKFYLDALKQVGGLPRKVRSDDGTENSMVAAVHTFLRSSHSDECKDIPSVLKLTFILSNSVSNEYRSVQAHVSDSVQSSRACAKPDMFTSPP